MQSTIGMPRGPYSRVYDPHAVIKWSWELLRDLEEARIEIETSNDFEEFEATCRDIEGRGELSEPFGGEYFDITPRDGLWIVGRRDGKIVQTQAMRLDRLEGISLATHWTKQFERIHDGMPGKNHAPGAFEMTGNVIYHGEMWVDKSLRGEGIAPTTCQYAHCLAMVKWAPDYIYCFMSDRNVAHGHNQRWGFSRAERGAIDWIRPPSDIDPTDWIAWSSMENILHNIRLATNPMLRAA